MTKITPIDWNTLIKIFELYGCQYIRKKGSHHILRCAGAKRAVVIPEYHEIGVDILKSNMRTVEMSREEFFALLKHVKG